MQALGGMTMLRIVLLFLSFTLAGAQAMAETRARVEVLVDVPLSQAWAYLADFSAAHNYVPNLSRTEIMSGQRHAL